jgi:outer membrane protein assembly factor BamB
VKVIQGVSVLAMLGLLAGCTKELILPGARFDVRTPLEQTQEGAEPVAAVVNRAVPIQLAAPKANADWTHRAGSPGHYMPHLALGAQLSQVWSANVGAGSGRKHRISAAPVVADGRVFALDSRATVTATGSNGAGLWSVDLTPETDRADDASGGGLAYGGGMLFVTTGFGELVAIEPASGKVAWRQKLGAPVTGAPTVSDGLVYVVARDSSAWAINAADGRVRWQLPGTPSVSGMVGTSAPAVSDRLVLFPFSSGEVAGALRKGGVRLWGATVAGQRRGRAYAGVSDITGDPVVVGNVTYVGTQSGRTVAIKTASGERIWTATEGAYGPVWVAGGSVFLVSDNAHLVRLDAETGAVIWSVEMPYFTKSKVKRRKAIHAHYGPIMAGGRLIVVSSDGLIRSFNPVDGALLGTTDLPGGAAAQPAVADGTLYVVNTRGQLLAFR